MTLLHGEINALNVLGKRVVDPTCFPDFTEVSYKRNWRFGERTDIEEIGNWIYQNLDGRYYVKMPKDRSEQFAFGFENPAEATYFTLGCPLLTFG